MPGIVVKCINTWKSKMPEYEYILWDTHKFDISSVKFVQDAYNARKWAFAADYIRLYAVYKEGGIYFDTDVYVLKSFNDLLRFDFFSSLERDLTTISPKSRYYIPFKQNENADYINIEPKRYRGFGLQAAIFGSCAKNPFIRDCMEWYEQNKYELYNGGPIESEQFLAPDIYAAIAQKYGFKYIAGFQELNGNMVILPADRFPNGLYKTDNAYAVHLCNNSWTGYYRYERAASFMERIKQNNFIRGLLGKRKYYTWEEKIKNGGESKLL